MTINFLSKNKIDSFARLLILKEQEFCQQDKEDGYLYHHHHLDDYHQGCEPWDGCNIQDRIEMLRFEWTYQPGADGSRDLEAQGLGSFWSRWAGWMDEGTALKFSNTRIWIYQGWTSLHTNHCCEETKSITCMDSVPVCMQPHSFSSPRWDNLPSGHQRYPLKGLNLGYMYWGQKHSSE